MTPNQTNAEGAFKAATKGKTLPDFIRGQFKKDPKLAWRELERRILVETNAKCIVSHTTLPTWYGDLKPEPADDAGEAA